ncbi:MAG TPA: TonB family protein [Verrucomicrobiae bacterium]|jgi:protein TonB|nr:TonB family protein [Verrucomicrobiae bacterium]
MAAGTYQLKSDLARVCLRSLDADANRRMAWVNSICIFFLIIGIVGARPELPVPKRPPPMEQPIPVLIEPLTAPPTSTAPKEIEPQNDEKQTSPQVVAVTLNTPAINFSVPTVGNLVVPMAAATAPPATELRQQAPVVQAPMVSGSTGDGGDRPKPEYPQLALQLGQQGTVRLLITVDDIGKVTSVSLTETSGSSLLDRDAMSWVKRRWIQPPINGGHTFIARITYKLQ